MASSCDEYKLVYNITFHMDDLTLPLLKRTRNECVSLYCLTNIPIEVLLICSARKYIRVDLFFCSFVKFDSLKNTFFNFQLIVTTLSIKMNILHGKLP